MGSDSTEKSPLEIEFETVVSAFREEIEQAVKEANEALTRAEQIASVHGIPFESPVSRITQSFLPASFHSKYFHKIPEDVISELTDVHHFPLYSRGWQHSQIC